MNFTIVKITKILRMEQKGKKFRTIQMYWC